MVEWRSLWSMQDSGGNVIGFISLDQKERVAHKVGIDTEVGKVALVYFKTLAKCRAMGPFEFDRYAAEWHAKQADLAAKNPEKAEAFYQALRDNEQERVNEKRRKTGEDLDYLYNQTEEPDAASGD